MAARILVVDDERNIVQLVKLYLTNEGFKVEAAGTGHEAIEAYRRIRPDLVVLDLMLPDIDGWEVCRQIRKESDVPIIFLTARTDDVDKIVGLEMGADDYVTKPFNPRELVARAKSVLRRYQSSPQAERPILVGDLRIDLARREVTVGTRTIELRAKEFDLLVALARHPGVVFDRDRLLNLVWGYDYPGETRTIDVHIAWLRDKLKDSTAQIQTVWGVGYKLTVLGTSR
ncbi:MAG: response regulator transcription factor [Chloroflexi bacterium]|nr:response regulator transcription factor [Chloroflexota bacterium]